MGLKTRGAGSGWTMEVTPAIAVLVADSSAFIKGASLEAWSGNVVTVREVVSEIKDVNTRQRLQVLPYDLSFREPSQHRYYTRRGWETYSFTE